MKQVDRPTRKDKKFAVVYNYKDKPRARSYKVLGKDAVLQKHIFGEYDEFMDIYKLVDPPIWEQDKVCDVMYFIVDQPLYRYGGDKKNG